MKEGSHMFKEPKIIKHFQFDFPLPKYSSSRSYQKLSKDKTKKAKNKHKFDKFSYYKTEEGIVKALFLNEDEYVDQGKYPFTDPSGKS